MTRSQHIDQAVTRAIKKFDYGPTRLKSLASGQAAIPGPCHKAVLTAWDKINRKSNA